MIKMNEKRDTRKILRGTKVGRETEWVEKG